MIFISANKLVKEVLFGLTAVFSGLVISGISSMPAYCQPNAADSWMVPRAGETAGELRRGELLVTALRREKIDGNSARLAMQSMGELFDFRLSRAGDRYLYKVGNNRKLVLLRYQRGAHAYETKLDENGQFATRLLDTVPIAEAAAQPQAFEAIHQSDEEGEVDVEHAALAAQMKSDSPSAQDPLPANDGSNASNSEQPADDALAGKVSPDAAFPDSDNAPADVHDAGGSLPAEIREEDLREDLPLPEQNSDLEQNNPVQADNVIVPAADTNRQPVFVARVQEKHESVVFSRISIVMFIVGIGLFLAALSAMIIPSLRARLRCRKAGLQIRDMIYIAARERIVLASADGHDCIIAVHPNHQMSFIAPCPPDDEKLWKHVKAKTYWYQMAQTPVPDRQLISIVSTFFEDDAPAVSSKKDETAAGLPIHEQNPADAVKFSDVPTARAVPDLSDFDDLFQKDDQNAQDN